ncbi:hypothetical protein HY637_03590 [Candidatus Woesearchaeota archaeon]|nr:hypothetical protein [Candidatus Woesearchaeota archaeon]
MHPEVLAASLKEKLKTRRLDVHNITYTYELRTHTQPNTPYSLQPDYDIAKETGIRIAEAIREGKSDLESTILIR